MILAKIIALKVICSYFLCLDDAMCDIAFSLNVNASGWQCISNTPASDPCTWYGVTCYGSNIVSIQLVNVTLPQTISVLSDLRFLDISNCLLSGTIPSSLGDITSLQAIHLTNDILYRCFLLYFWSYFYRNREINESGMYF